MLRALDLDRWQQEEQTAPFVARLTAHPCIVMFYALLCIAPHSLICLRCFSIGNKVAQLRQQSL